MVKYTIISRAKFERMFETDKMMGWENFGGFFTKESAINQMESYSGKGKWALVPPAKRTKSSGGYYNVLFKRNKR